MSERKYRQRGYQDEPRDRRPAAQRPPPDRKPGRPEPRPMRAPNMPGFRETVRCARCGHPVSGAIAKDSQCGRCGADLHACAQCAWFDTSRRFECGQPIPARITPKDSRNACDLFEPRVVVERETGSAAPTAPSGARKAFDDLFK
jgi:hypothetical protein